MGGHDIHITCVGILDKYIYYHYYTIEKLTTTEQKIFQLVLMSYCNILTSQDLVLIHAYYGGPILKKKSSCVHLLSYHILLRTMTN